MNPLLRIITSSAPGVAFRSGLRRSPAGRWLLSRMTVNFNRSYEQRFHEAIVTGVRPGDIVWDIGANVGLYTRIFLDAVGPSGRIVAVEPAPASAAACRALVAADDRRLAVIESAMGESAGTAQLAMHHATASNNRLATDERDAQAYPVRVITGDMLLDETGAAPTLAKIDVEGFELNVLRGMPKVLSGYQLRTLFIEVHFALLEAGGVKDAPRQIEALLRPHGFDLDWVDFSHVVARRRPTRSA